MTFRYTDEYMLGSYNFRQRQWWAKNNLKVGDMILLVREPLNYEDGWKCSWLTDLNKFINKYVKIEFYHSDEKGIDVGIDNRSFYVPYFVLSCKDKERIQKLEGLEEL